MIKILQYIGSLDFGGSQAFIMEVYRKINKEEIQFDFITFPNEKNGFYDEILKLGGKVYEAPKFNGKNGIEFIKWWNNFFKQHKEYKILHGHVRSCASLYVPIAKKNSVKTIVHSHSTSNGKGVEGIVKKILQFPIRYQADYLFACSSIAGEWLFGKKALKKDNYYMINNCIDVEKYRYNSEIRNQMRKELGLENKIVYGHVGRLIDAKNHMFLLEVFKEIYIKNNNSVLIIVGDGELKEEIKNKIELLNLQGAVLMLGSRNDVEKLMQAMDILLFPSKWEGLPVTVVEAQAAGLPCFISDTITTDIDISKAVYYLPIDKGTDIWVDKINVCLKNRMDVIEDIKQAGFDINGSVIRLEELYKNIYEL